MAPTPEPIRESQGTRQPGLFEGVRRASVGGENVATDREFGETELRKSYWCNSPAMIAGEVELRSGEDMIA